jgi:hypothetical protein
MKKILLSLVCLSSLCMSYADEHGLMFSLKQGYFVPQDKNLRNIFDCHGSKGGYFIEGALRYNVWDCLYLELNSSYFSHKGRASVTTISCNDSSENCCEGCGECVKFKMPTLGFGVKYFYWFHDCISFFVGGGLKAFFVRIKNDSPYVQRCNNKNELGGFLHTGFMFDVYKGLSIELFADYFGTRLERPCTDISSITYRLNVGGFAGGLGIGYSF